MGELMLGLDVGNTHTGVGLFEDGKLVRNWRLSTHAERTADESGLWLRQLLGWHDVHLERLVGVAVASVVPQVDAPLAEAVRTYLGVGAFFVRPGSRTGLSLRVKAPQELGADRLCNAVAAFEKYGGPAVVIDFGTAATWEVVSKAGEYIGGVIAPGPGITAEALFARTAKLPRVTLEPPPRVIGRATVDAMQSGLFYGYIGLVQGVTASVVAELQDPVVVAAGGFGATVAEHCDLIDHVEPNLTLEGLAQLWGRNRGTDGA